MVGPSQGDGKFPAIGFVNDTTRVAASFVAEVEHRDITSEGLLPQRSFKGLTKGNHAALVSFILQREIYLMAEPSEKEIEIRAYELWEKAGKPEGKDEEFYHLAQQELRNEDKSSPLRTPDTL